MSMRNIVRCLLGGFALSFFPMGAMAAGGHLNGADLSLVWALPFAGILLSIAVLPLVAPTFWHHHFGKMSAFWAMAFLVPFTIEYGFSIASFQVIEVLLHEYIPFIILLLSLFTVAGGVRLRGKLRGTPMVNTAILAFGTLIASIMGTTGAAMLLIRPVLRANELRENKTHIFVFFIFLVANIGGSLTPLGDPPLFLGFLKGVDFFWPTTHMILPVLVMASILLTVFYFLDRYYFSKEKEAFDQANEEGDEPEHLQIDGKINLILLLGVMGAVLMSGLWDPDIEFLIHGVSLQAESLIREALLLALALLSLLLTDPHSRQANGFTWFPIVEVGKLFAGIFITIVPAIAILKAGQSGALAVIVDAVNHDGEPHNAMYFWVTGILSSFLDNAPTYLVFFNTAAGDAVKPAEYLMNEQPLTLLAISAGAVFMGANTYIGNAPNFMVRAIAEERGIKMPSFFGYMGWSVMFLMPCFALITLLFF